MNELSDRQEVLEIYMPLCQHLATQIEQAARPGCRKPYVIGIGGSVAAGKSTTARLLETLLARYWPGRQVALVTTDGFLYPNQELERRGLMARKGFPESYDMARLYHFLKDARAGLEALEVPVYSHLLYDIIGGHKQQIVRPDVLIVEGLSVLQTPAPEQPKTHPFISDLFDFKIYVHAHENDLARWYTERFLALRATAFQQPESYFRRYAHLSDAEACGVAADVWSRINAPNLVANIAPSMPRAHLILPKARDHRVHSVWLRTA
jgi:type I pantothenate kinase